METFQAEKNGGDVFFASDAYAEFETESPTGFETHQYFAVKKKPVDAEIDITKLPPSARQLFEDPKNGSRKVEWDNMISQIKAEGGPAVRIHRGAQARKYKEQYPHRLLPSRWLEKWKDKGDEYTTPLPPHIAREASVHPPQSQIAMDPARIS